MRQTIWTALLLLAMSLGCSDPNIAGNTFICTTDDDCAAGHRCIDGLCLPPDAVMPGDVQPLPDVPSDQPADLPEATDACPDPCLAEGETRCVGDDVSRCESTPEGCLTWSSAEPSLCARRSRPMSPTSPTGIVRR